MPIQTHRSYNKKSNYTFRRYTDEVLHYSPVQNILVMPHRQRGVLLAVAQYSQKRVQIQVALKVAAEVGHGFVGQVVIGRYAAHPGRLQSALVLPDEVTIFIYFQEVQ